MRCGQRRGLARLASAVEVVASSTAGGRLARGTTAPRVDGRSAATASPPRPDRARFACAGAIPRRSAGAFRCVPMPSARQPASPLGARGTPGSSASEAEPPPAHRHRRASTSSLRGRDVPQHWFGDVCRLWDVETRHDYARFGTRAGVRIVPWMAPPVDDDLEAGDTPASPPRCDSDGARVPCDRELARTHVGAYAHRM